MYLYPIRSPLYPICSVFGMMTAFAEGVETDIKHEVALSTTTKTPRISDMPFIVAGQVGSGRCFPRDDNVSVPALFSPLPNMQRLWHDDGLCWRRRNEETKQKRQVLPFQDDEDPPYVWRVSPRGGPSRLPSVLAKGRPRASTRSILASIQYAAFLV